MDSPTLNRELYEFEADIYRITPEAEEALIHRRALVRKILPRDPGAAVLDVGCGDGAISIDLSQRTEAMVVGADLAIKRVSFARETAGNLSFTQGSCYELPFADNSFPTVVCCDLLEHLDEPARAFAELMRVSSRFVLLTVPYSIDIEKTLCPHCLKDYYLYGHQHSFGKQGVAQLAQQAGGRVQQFEHVIPMFECRRYKYFPPLKWLIWNHFKNSGTLGARIEKLHGRPTTNGHN
jgi:ubiquinone/menaquinone biosynthesis C-methylase UbiE